MGFLTGTNILMMHPSVELTKLIPAGCIYCYEKLNITDRKAMIVGPCQHIFCKRCVNQVIFKNKQLSDCSECFKQVHQSFVKPSKYFEKIFQTFQQLSKYQLDEDKPEEMQKKVALTFSSNKDYECLKCRYFFDSQKRRPVNLCKNQHIICELCLKSNEQDFKKCKQCGEKTDPQYFYFNNMVMNICDFITKTLYTTKLYFTYAEQQLSLTIDGSLSIKDVFHGLQEYNLIPKDLEIKHCKFEAKATKASQKMKIDVNWDKKIDNIKMQMGIQQQVITISMECDQQAKRMGGEVTMCSKVVNELPIKINSFQPQQKFIFNKSDFGDVHKVEKSQIYPSLKKKRIFNQELPKNESLNSKYGSSRLSHKKNEKDNNESQYNYSKGQSHGKYKNSSYRPFEAIQMQKKNIQKQQYSSKNKYKVYQNQPSNMQIQKQQINLYPTIESKLLFGKRGQSENQIQKSKYNNPYLESKIRSKAVLQHEKEIQNDINPIKSRFKLSQQSQFRAKSIIAQQASISYRKQSKIKKRLEKERGTKIEDERMYKLASNAPQYERGQIWNKFLINHEVKDQDQALICLMCEKIMNRQFTEGELSTSKALQKQINEQAETGAKSAKPSKTALLSMILKILKAELNDGKIQVIFTPKSTDRSKLSLKTITSHFLSDRVILKQVLDEDQQWYFQKLYDSNEDLQNFVAKQRKRVSQSFGVSENSLVFHDIIKGSNILVMSTNQSVNVVNHLKVNLNRKIEFHPYFTRLQLSPADFDQKGCIDFPINGNHKDKRGGLPYYQPINCSRYGIKVSKIFDNGNDGWLSMDNRPGEWAVAFHGVKHPNAAFKSYKSVVQSILSSLHRSQKEKLIVVQNIKQIHRNDNCINKKGQKIGDGVYLTPFFVQALPFTTVIDISQKQYNLVFQCRLNPQNIKFSAENQNIWVVNRSADIRPYGIVLIEHKKGYPSPLAQFGENFDYNKYKDQFSNKPVLPFSKLTNLSKKSSNLSSMSK